MKNADWLWPSDKRIAVVFNVCLEQWSDGKAPGISPMGNPLPAGVLDTMAISWAAYGLKTGIYRLLEAFKRHGAKTSVMVNAVCAERAPEAVKAIADGGHEVLSHSYAMDVGDRIMVFHRPARIAYEAKLDEAAKTTGRQAVQDEILKDLSLEATDHAPAA